MKKCNWFVVGMDYTCGGYHGMYTCGYLMNATYKEAMDYGVDLSYGVMESYSCIADNLEYEYDDNGKAVRKSDEDIEDAYAENVEFIVAPFREDLSVEYINNEIMNIDNNLDYEEILDTYCIRNWKWEDYE